MSRIFEYNAVILTDLLAADYAPRAGRYDPESG